MSVARVGLVVLVVGLVSATLGLRQLCHADFMRSQRYEDIYYLPPTDWLHVFALNFDEAVADGIWMRALVYFGDELRARGQSRFALTYARAAIRLDPEFRAAYRWGGMAGLYRANADLTPEDMRDALAILEEGARRFPRDGDLAWDCGAGYVYELAPHLEGDEAQEARQRGSEYLMAASRLGAAPDWAVLANSQVLRQAGQAEQAARHLEEMYFHVRSESVRREIAQRVVELRMSARAEATLEAVRQLEAERLAQMPYVSFTLYQFLGPKPLLDRWAGLREGVPAAFQSELP